MRALRPRDGKLVSTRGLFGATARQPLRILQRVVGLVGQPGALAELYLAGALRALPGLPCAGEEGGLPAWLLARALTFNPRDRPDAKGLLGQLEARLDEEWPGEAGAAEAVRRAAEIYRWRLAQVSTGGVHRDGNNHSGGSSSSSELGAGHDAEAARARLHPGTRASAAPARCAPVGEAGVPSSLRSRLHPHAVGEEGEGEGTRARQSGIGQSGSGQSGSGQSGIGQSRSGQSAGQPQQPPPPGVPPASGNARQAVEYLREMRSTDGPRPSHASAVSAGRPHMPPAGGAQLASAAGGGGQYARRPSGTSAAECGRTLSHVAMSRPGWASGAEQPESVASASRYKGAYPVDPRW
ncbi:hypothetical protein T492DRAFT_969268 [Pavlovales sp. CCMP2436]|nr:hypothetical protein T492DRAFT_969268 [Pavlovales sp. CCMP2436]